MEDVNPTPDVLEETPVTKDSVQEKMKDFSTPKASVSKQKPTGSKMRSVILAIIASIMLILLATALAWVTLRPTDETKNGVESESEPQKDTEETGEMEDEVGEVDLEEEEEPDLPDGETEDSPADEDAEEDEPVPVVTDLNRILYIKDENLWVVNNDGTGKTQITTDGNGVTVQYRAIDWKESGIISYSKCAGSCKIYTRDLATDIETEILEGIPFTQSFDAIEWSHDENSLAYIFTKGDYSKEASLWTGGSTTVLESYAPPPGRGGHYDDGGYLEFSLDDSKVLVLNTIIDTTFNKPVILFEIDGTKTVELANTTFPTFDGNDAFYYKSTTTGNLDRWDILTASSSTVMTFTTTSIHDLHTSPDGYFVLFWSDISGTSPTQGYYDTGGSPSPLITDYLGGKWLDEDSVYIVTEEVSEISDAGFFMSGGISKVKRTDGTTTVLDTGGIYTFEVE